MTSALIGNFRETVSHHAKFFASQFVDPDYIAQPRYPYEWLKYKTNFAHQLCTICAKYAFSKFYKRNCLFVKKNYHDNFCRSFEISLGVNSKWFFRMYIN